MTKYLVVAIIILLSCNSVEEDLEPTVFFKEVVGLESETLNFSGIEFNTPLEMMVLDSILVVHDQYPRGDDMYLFSLINLNNEVAPVKLFGREGRGPNEYLFPSSISRFPENSNYLGINNRQLFSLSVVSVEELLKKERLDSLLYINKLDYNFSKVVPLSDSIFIGTGFFESGRFGLANQDGQIKNVFLEYPYLENYPDFTNRELGMTFQSDLKVHSMSNKIAVSTFASASLDILHFIDDSIYSIKSLNFYPPKFKSSSSGTRLSTQALPENVSGFIRMTVSNSFIYLLYSGVKRSEGLDKYLSGYRVLKFNWQGEPITQYNLDAQVTMISVDDNDEFLLAMHTNTNGKPVLLKYKLK